MTHKYKRFYPFLPIEKYVRSHHAGEAEERKKGRRVKTNDQTIHIKPLR